MLRTADRLRFDDELSTRRCCRHLLEDVGRMELDVAIRRMCEGEKRAWRLGNGEKRARNRRGL